MEQTMVHLAHAALWFFFVTFVFALIGLYATIHWLVNLFRRGESAVESGINTVERKL